MLEDLGLKLYLPREGKAAHLAKSLPGADGIYIFCNRYRGRASGPLLDAGAAPDQPVCSACLAALEVTIERMAALTGQPLPPRPDAK